MNVLTWVCLVVSLLYVPAAGLAQYVHASGKQIVDGANRPLHLHGINLGNWLVPEGYMWKFEGGPQSPREIEEFVLEMLGPERSASFWKTYRETYITRDDIHRIKQMGFDSVRVPIHYKFFEMDNAEGFRLLDHVIGWCGQEGLLVVIDLHAAPGGQTGTNIDDSNGYPWLFKDETAQRQTIQLWTRIAKHYRDNKTVMGYDLLNEPIPHFPELRPLDPLLEPFYKRITAAIRIVDIHHAIILGGAKWDSDFSVFGAPFDPNLIYQLHTYWAPPVQATVQKYVDFRSRLDVPVWLGESGENTDEWVGQFARLLEKNDIGWAFWPYKKMDATSSPVTFAQPDGWAEIIAYAKLGRGLGDVEKRIAKRPSQEVIDRAFASLLENIRSDHERENEGYIHALLPAKTPLICTCANFRDWLYAPSRENRPNRFIWANSLHLQGIEALQRFHLTGRARYRYCSAFLKQTLVAFRVLTPPILRVERNDQRYSLREAFQFRLTSEEPKVDRTGSCCRLGGTARD